MKEVDRLKKKYPKDIILNKKIFLEKQRLIFLEIIRIF